MFNNVSSTLQKTYDECFLTCSTAVYFEGQNNEAEALRSWKNALDQIAQYRHATRSPAYQQRLRSETDRTLQESLQQLELQCKERVDLLEALKKSRQEAQQQTPPTAASHHGDPFADAASSAGLGGGTVPPVNYADLYRPPLPQRPSLPPRRVSAEARGSTTSLPLGLSKPSRSPHSLSPAPQARMSQPSRTPSPEKKTRMLRTLRPGNGKNEGRRTSSSRASAPSTSRPPVAAKAANLAFGSNASAKLSRPVYQGKPSSESLVAPPQAPSSRSSFDVARTKPDAGSSVLACSAASRSWSDLGNERSERPERPTGLSSRPPPPPLPRYPVSSNRPVRRKQLSSAVEPLESLSLEVENTTIPQDTGQAQHRKARGKQKKSTSARADLPSTTSSDADSPNYNVSESENEKDEWQSRVKSIMKNLPRGVDESAARQILNEIVIKGDEVHWTDVAGLDVAKSALKETVVYPFLRPDLFMGLREPARGLLLFGPPGTGKTMLARAVATESKSTFFAISASSLTSKFLGESEKLVRALFALAKVMAPSIIFVDEIDSLLSSRSDAGEHEATRRIKTEFLIQWSDLAKAAAGRESQSTSKEKEGDPNMVLVLAATNLPWAIDDAARRRFVRRQYIPLPEAHVRRQQLETLLSHQKHEVDDLAMQRLVLLTEGFSGSDITALAKDAAMGPLRSLGEKLLHMRMDEIRPIQFEDFEASLRTIRPSVSQEGLRRYEEWAREFGERGG